MAAYERSSLNHRVRTENISRGSLEPGLWERLLNTYSDTDYQHTWEALFAACELFRETALTVAEHFEYPYPSEDDHRVSAHLEHINGLSRDAEEIY